MLTQTLSEKIVLLAKQMHEENKKSFDIQIPFEFWKLKDAIDKYGYESAVIVLCGDSGWTLKQEYLNSETKAHFESVYPGVTIVDEETFRQQLTTN